eukprot:Awhi_evm1s13670
MAELNLNANIESASKRTIIKCNTHIVKDDEKMREYLSSELDDKFKDVNFKNYDIEETFDYDKFSNDLVDIYEKVVGRREIVVHNNPEYIPSSIRNKFNKYNNLTKSAGFRRKTVQNKKLLRDMDIDTTQTSTAERKLPDGGTTIDSDPREVMKIDTQLYESLANELKAEAENYVQDFKLYVQKELEKIKSEVVDMSDESSDSEFSLDEVT